MKPKKGEGSEPEIQQPDEGNWAIFTEQDKSKAEKQVAERIASNMAIWAASLELYNALVHEWTKSRQNALWKTMTTLSEIQASDSGSKVERAADVLVEQWTSFGRDFLALQLKTMANAGTLVEKAQEVSKSTESDIMDRAREAWKRARPAK